MFNLPALNPRNDNSVTNSFLTGNNLANTLNGQNASTPINDQFINQLSQLGLGSVASTAGNTGDLGVVPTTSSFLSGAGPESVGSIAGGSGGLGLSSGATGANAVGEAGTFAGLGDFLFGSTAEDGSQTGGAALPLISLGQGIFNGFLGNKQLNLAKDQFKQRKREFSKNFEAQAKITNGRIRDRQRARLANDPSRRSIEEAVRQDGINI